jgi:hypothetical protein
VQKASKDRQEENQKIGITENRPDDKERVPNFARRAAALLTMAGRRRT